MSFHPRLLSCLLCCLPISEVLAQTSLATATPVRPGEKRTFVLKTSPIDLLIPHITTLWLGGEAWLAPKWSAELDFGYVFRDDGLFNLTTTFPDLAFRSTDRSRINFNLKGEVRRYLGRAKGLNGFYGAGQLTYKQVNFNSNKSPGYDWHEYSSLFYDTGHYWAPSRQGPESNYHLRQREMGVSAKLGYQHIFSRFALDFFAGVGVRYIRITQDLGEPSPGSYEYKYGGSWVPVPVVGGKLGYAF